MNSNARKWVEALRSGEFKQGEFVLHQVDTDSFCCLGVACRLAAEAGVQLEEAVREVRGNYNGRCTYFDGRHTGLPTGVMAWLSLGDACGRYDSDSLAALNDSAKTFSEIADIIESEPPGLFVEQKGQEQ